SANACSNAGSRLAHSRASLRRSSRSICALTASWIARLRLGNVPSATRRSIRSSSSSSRVIAIFGIPIVGMIADHTISARLNGRSPPPAPRAIPRGAARVLGLRRAAGGFFGRSDGAHRFRPRVPWLIDTELSTSRQRDLREQTPTLVLNGRARNAPLLHRGDELLDVVAHQIELVDVVILRGVDGHFCRRQTEDQPAFAHIDVRHPEHLAQKGAIGLRLLAVNDRMRSDDHGSPPRKKGTITLHTTG